MHKVIYVFVMLMVNVIFITGCATSYLPSKEDNLNEHKRVLESLNPDLIEDDGAISSAILIAPDRVPELIEKGFSVTSVNGSKSPLNTLIERRTLLDKNLGLPTKDYTFNSVDIAQQLIDAGAINEKNHEQESKVFYSIGDQITIYADDIEYVEDMLKLAQLLIDSGLDFHYFKKSYLSEESPLSEVVEKKFHLSITKYLYSDALFNYAKLLMRNGMSAEKDESILYTLKNAFFYTKGFETELLEITQWYLDNGVDPNYIGEFSKNFVYDISSERWRKKLIPFNLLLLSHGANIDCAELKGEACLMSLPLVQHDRNKTTRHDKRQALKSAIAYQTSPPSAQELQSFINEVPIADGKVDYIKVLINRRPQALTTAPSRPYQYDTLAVARQLIESGAVIDKHIFHDISSSIQSYEGSEVYLRGTDRKNAHKKGAHVEEMMALAQLLIDRGQDLNQTLSFNGNKKSPVYTALIANQLDYAEFLIRNGVTIKDSDLDVLFEPIGTRHGFALSDISEQRLNIAQWYLDQGIDPNYFRRSTREFAIEKAFSYGPINYAVFLLENGAEIRCTGLSQAVCLSSLFTGTANKKYIELFTLLLDKNRTMLERNDANAHEDLAYIKSLITKHFPERSDYLLLVMAHGVDSADQRIAEEKRIDEFEKEQKRQQLQVVSNFIYQDRQLREQLNSLVTSTSYCRSYGEVRRALLDMSCNSGDYSSGACFAEQRRLFDQVNKQLRSCNTIEDKRAFTQQFGEQSELVKTIVDQRIENEGLVDTIIDPYSQSLKNLRSIKNQEINAQKRSSQKGMADLVNYAKKSFSTVNEGSQQVSRNTQQLFQKAQQQQSVYRNTSAQNAKVLASKLDQLKQQVAKVGMPNTLPITKSDAINTTKNNVSSEELCSTFTLTSSRYHTHMVEGKEVKYSTDISPSFSGTYWLRNAPKGESKTRVVMKDAGDAVRYEASGKEVKYKWGVLLRDDGLLECPTDQLYLLLMFSTGETNGHTVTKRDNTMCVESNLYHCR